MPTRMNRRDVERAARAHTHVLRMLGVDAPRFAIEPGSKVNGVAWRMVAMDAAGQRRRPPIGSDVVGYTASEAYDTITDRTSLLYDVRRAMIDAGHELPAVKPDYEAPTIAEMTVAEIAEVTS